MKKLISLVLALAMAMPLFAGFAAAEEDSILGKPFPDFTLTDVDGNTFTLSESLKDHEAALITIWATWCPPCYLEFPFLNEVYAQYKDRVAFMALSCEMEDTPEMIREYRETYGFSLPMGRDEGEALYRYTQSLSIPVSVIVDRFGNAVFMHNSCFKSSREVRAALDCFLGDSYTETAVLNEIPVDDATAVYPVATARSVSVEGENVRQLSFRNDEPPYRLAVYLVGDSAVTVRFQLTAADDPHDIVLYDADAMRIYELSELSAKDDRGYAYDVQMPDNRAMNVSVSSFTSTDISEAINVFLLPNEALLSDLCELLRTDGWTYVDGEAPEAAPQDAPQAYVLHVTDQYGEPVSGVYVNFCTDTLCSMMQADEAGVITFAGEPDVYHVQLLRVPAGYSYDPGLEIYVGRDYGEWLLHIRKD